MRGSRRMRWLAPAVAVAAVLGCSSATEPGIQPQVTNATDNFQYQVSNVQNFTGPGATAGRPQAPTPT